MGLLRLRGWGGKGGGGVGVGGEGLGRGEWKGGMVCNTNEYMRLLLF